jgi:arylsulfatase A-like enzyme
MLMTGRQALETGHVINFVRTRHDEMSIADSFNNAGYTTGWVGKWHLFSGPEPEAVDFEYIPDGRDRLGFHYFRAYNYHTQYFDGTVCLDNGDREQWHGYETDGLMKYVDEFLQDADGPFCLFVSPHMPHHGGPIPGGRSTQDASPIGRLAPGRFLDEVPERPSLPPNVPEALTEHASDCYRDYLAMTLAVDEMVGRILQILEGTELLENTVVVFGSDHGSLMGSHGPCAGEVSGDYAEAVFWQPWQKRTPWEESLSVPLLIRYPDMRHAGIRSDMLVSPTDIFPTLCGLCGIEPPKTVTGKDLAGSWIGRVDGGDGGAGSGGKDSGREVAAERDRTAERDALFCYYVNDAFFSPGGEWRGVRTKRWNYFRYLNGESGLYDIRVDPFQMCNLVDDNAYGPVKSELEARMADFVAQWNDEFMPAPDYRRWFENRHVLRNCFGELGDPLKDPDWSLL